MVTSIQIDTMVFLLSSCMLQLADLLVAFRLPTPKLESSRGRLYRAIFASERALSILLGALFRFGSNPEAEREVCRIGGFNPMIAENRTRKVQGKISTESEERRWVSLCRWCSLLTLQPLSLS
jgi:hypothetical protein